MDPQAPNIPPTPFGVNSIHETPQNGKDGHMISVLAMAIFVVLSLSVVAFLYYQNQQLKSMLASIQTPVAVASPTPTATADPTADWKTYTNTKVGFQIKYPPGGFSKPELPSGVAGSPEVYADNNTDNNDIIFGNSLPSLEVFDYSGNLDQFINYYMAGKAPISGGPVGENVVSTADLQVDGVPAKKQETQPKIVYPETKDNVSTFIYFVSHGHGFVFNGGTPESDQILSTFKFTSNASPTPSPVESTNYIVPSGWQKFTTQDGLKLCIPPNWQTDQYGTLIYDRDANYKPQITAIQSIPYSNGSYANAYYNFWKEWGDVSKLVTASQVNINGNMATTFTPIGEVKTSPEGLTVVWYASGKLWKAGLSSWSMINPSQTAFLKDFYTAISCSF